jgi:aspartokinase/homoserine dehydrogenase 1
VSVRAIAQGSSERNISVVIDQQDAARGLRATHSAFFLSEYTISVGLIGYGNIGKTFIKQISEQKAHLREKFNLDVRLRAITDSKSMWLAERDMDLTDPASLSAARGKPLQLDELLKHVKADHIPHACLIDCTSNDAVAEHYSEWLNEGVHIITPNKKAGSGPMERYQKIKTLEAQSHRSFLYEATVGAGLPIISTLRDLLQTGDEIISIEGILSGTLSFIFNQFSADKPFSEVLKLAQSKGYTEPDPRDDLSGIDVGRKIVILAREAGFKLDLNHVKIESLVPKELALIKSPEEFMQSAHKMDGEFLYLCKEADAENQVLRFTGFVNARGEAQVGLRRFPKTHPFARVSATDNIISFRTKRYDQQPLIVQGPGAGPEVTAGGIFADLLRLARSLGASA